MDTLIVVFGYSCITNLLAVDFSTLINFIWYWLKGCVHQFALPDVVYQDKFPVDSGFVVTSEGVF